MREFIESVSSHITENNIALLSVIITVLIFIISRHSELRYKKHDDKKVQYLKLIHLMEQFLIQVGNDENDNLALSSELKQQFFDTGASLLLYGSKKIYRYYLLFREFTTNPLIYQSKYYKDDLAVYVMAEILVTIRKEVGLSYFNSIRNSDALAFFVNDVSSNPIAKEKAIDAKFRIKMIRFELAIIDQTRFIFIKEMYTKIARPIFAGSAIILKYAIVIPLGVFLNKVFPDLVQKK